MTAKRRNAAARRPGRCRAARIRRGVNNRRIAGDVRAELAKAEARVANQRRDGLHKLTSRLVREFGTIVIEDLNVAGMVRNRCLAKSIHDGGFGEFRRQLTYKTAWSGARLVVADRFYPSSKTCSRCRSVKAKLGLRERVFRCEVCGLVLDRDLNAARNLAALAVAAVTPWASSASCVATVNVPAGNRVRRARARSGTATGRPAPSGAGQPGRGNPAGQGMLSHVS
ncbi:RNA-guided endonuclease TnpB family protein [Nocardia sp. NPDC051030]|uniref:RNA-guided endonuclease InsQ/TnpB family protein n=1 Tax=Nocardia sp. NPDC051030 TaxID=3155162 RepID=UPI003448B24A